MRQDRRPKRETSIQIGGQEELQMIWIEFFKCEQGVRKQMKESKWRDMEGLQRQKKKIRKYTVRSKDTFSTI